MASGSSNFMEIEFEFEFIFLQLDSTSVVVSEL